MGIYVCFRTLKLCLQYWFTVCPQVSFMSSRSRVLCPIFLNACIVLYCIAHSRERNTASVAPPLSLMWFLDHIWRVIFNLCPTQSVQVRLAVPTSTKGDSLKAVELKKSNSTLWGFSIWKNPFSPPHTSPAPFCFLKQALHILSVKALLKWLSLLSVDVVLFQHWPIENTQMDQWKNPVEDIANRRAGALLN